MCLLSGSFLLLCWKMTIPLPAVSTHRFPTDAPAKSTSLHEALTFWCSHSLLIFCSQAWIGPCVFTAGPTNAHVHTSRCSPAVYCDFNDCWVLFTLLTISFTSPSALYCATHFTCTEEHFHFTVHAAHNICISQHINHSLSLNCLYLDLQYILCTQLLFALLVKSSNLII